MNCKHCGREIVEAGQWWHVIGEGSLLMRCKTSESNKPYGLNAEPE